MKKFWRKFSLILLVGILLGLLGFTLWASNPAAPEARALDTIVTSPYIQKTSNRDWLVFGVENDQPQIGLILYPGARVDYRAYAPQAESIARNGFMVVVVRMPLNLAFLGINQAVDVMEAYPDVETWFIGGHSLGGAMAAEFTASHPDLVSGLVLLGAYPGANTDLSDYKGSVLSITAGNDGLATLDEITDSKGRLPEDTQFINIEGGNHAGFGWYGVQNGDGTAEISKEAQQEQIINANVSFLQGLAK